MSDKLECNVCGGSVPVKKDGNFWKHPGLDGSDCPGVPSEREAEVGSVPKGGAYEEVSENIYTIPMRMNPEGFLNDSSWHDANKMMVLRDAESKGHQLSGDPVFRGVEKDSSSKKPYLVKYAYKVRT